MATWEFVNYFKKCRRCGRFKSYRSFRQPGSRVCAYCYTSNGITGPGLARSITITDKGRAYLAAEREAAA